MTKYFIQIPSNNFEYLFGKISSAEVDASNEDQYKGVHLFDTEREARMYWIKNEYSAAKDAPDHVFDERGFIKR